MNVVPAMFQPFFQDQFVNVRLIIIPIQMQVSVLNVTPRVITAVARRKTNVQNATLLLHLMVVFARVHSLTSPILLRKAVPNVTPTVKAAKELQIISGYHASPPIFSVKGVAIALQEPFLAPELPTA